MNHKNQNYSTFFIHDLEFMGCPMEQDETWNITWPTTNVSQVAIQKCRGGSEVEGTYTTTVKGCMNVICSTLQHKINELCRENNGTYSQLNTHALAV